MKAPRFPCPKILVVCKCCKRYFLRYDYGKGRKRLKRYKRGYAQGIKAHTKDSCIFCRGTVKILAEGKGSEAVLLRYITK